MFRKLNKPESMSIKNSFELVKVLENVKLQPDEILVSVDVEALYPSTPVEEAYIFLSEWITEQGIPDEKVEVYKRLVRLVLDQRWVKFKGQIYKQKEGLFIGNSLSPILSEVFMGSLEKSMKNKPWFPKLWARYIDDIVVKIKRNALQQLMVELNNMHPSIKFTFEEESSGQLPFLDLKLIREGDGIELDIYRKPTDAPLCIPADSHHAWPHKLAAFESAFFRMWNLPLSEERRDKELDYLIYMGKINGYKENIIKAIYNKHKRKIGLKRFTKLQPYKKREDASKEGIKNVVIPYYKPLTKEIERLLKGKQINLCYNSRGNLREIIGKTKDDKSEKEKSGIYEISCSNCELKYIGQTKRRLEIREKEHERAVRLKQPNKSSVAQHCLTQGHRMGTCKLVKKVDRERELDAWESMYITKSREEELMNAAEPPIHSKIFKYCFK